MKTQQDWRSELSEDPLTRYNQLRDDPWLFLKWCVFTHDEVDAENPIKRYPSHLMYLRFLVMMWQKKKKLAIPKSRRLTVSWTFISLALWDCIFHKGRSWAFVSKKELDSAELVERAEFIFNHIPSDILSPDMLPKLKNGRMMTAPPVLEFTEIYSKIMGFPSGGNQLRQRGFSGILEDECAFWDDAEAAYASAKPTVDGGGRLVMVSTRFPGFFKKICYDKLNHPDLNFSAIPPVPPQKAMEGVEVWTNPDNEFFIVDLSHRANPAKRSPEFEEGLKKTLPIHLYRQEYGKSWDTFAGKAVYEDFNELIHATHTRPKFWTGLPLLLGWDSSGLTPAVVCAQLQEDRLVVFKEIIGMGMGAERFVPHVISEIKLAFPGQITDIEKQTVSFFDPAAFRKNEITEETYLNKMYDGGFKEITPGPMTWNARVDAVVSFLVGLTKGQPKFQVYENDCPVLTAGLKGGFRYPDKMLDVEANKPQPIKDIHSHPNDALQYLCGGIIGKLSNDYNFEIKTPQYSFQKSTEARNNKGTNYGRKVT